MSFLRGRIAYVQQDPFLFAGSYFDNVCYGLDEAEVASVRRQRLVEKVTKIVQMEDFIKRQPNGFNHEVGPKGHALSGGQRQRVALARALLRQPRLLVRILPCLVVYFMLQLLHGLITLLSFLSGAHKTSLAFSEADRNHTTPSVAAGLAPTRAPLNGVQMLTGHFLNCEDLSCVCSI